MTLQVSPQDAPCGAVVRGVDLSQPLDATTSAAIRAAWLQHQVLAFVDQAMTLEEVGREFGVTRERIRQVEAKAIRQLRARQLDAMIVDNTTMQVRSWSSGINNMILSYESNQ